MRSTEGLARIDFGDKAHSSVAQFACQALIGIVVGLHLAFHVHGHDAHHVVHAINQGQHGIRFGRLEQARILGLDLNVVGALDDHGRHFQCCA